MTFPNWKGRTVVIGASGPSQRQEDLDAARGNIVVVINETWKLAPWATALYACDEPWWRQRGPAPSQFKGRRFVATKPFEGCTHIDVVKEARRPIFDGKRLAGGLNSGYQAINLAAACGAKKIILLGYDLKGNGTHWHGPHGPGLNNPSGNSLRSFARRIEEAKKFYDQRGIEIINASRKTALRNYPKMSLEAALCKS